MNGNRMPPGQGVPQQDRRGGRHFNQHNQGHFAQQQAQVYYPYGQSYPAYNDPNAYNGHYGYQPPMNVPGFYPAPIPYQQHYPQRQPQNLPAQQWAQYPPPPYHGGHPPPSSPPMVVPQALPQQYDPGASFTPRAAQVQRPPLVTSQTSSTAYIYSPKDAPSHPSPRPVSQASNRQSPPPLPQVSQPLYTEPESPEPQQRTEIYVAPLPFFPPLSRVPWPIKYIGDKEQSPPREGRFVWVTNPSQVSRRGGFYRKELDVFSIMFEETDTIEAPLPPTNKLASPATALSTVDEQSESSTGKKGHSIEGQHKKESASTTPEGASEPGEQTVETQSREFSVEETPTASEVAPSSPSPSSRTVEPDEKAASEKPAASASKPPPSWAGLFKGPAASGTAPPKNSVASKTASPVASSTTDKPNNGSLADALHACVSGALENKISFLEPRGLVNTGNMCYMNSVLQVLVFCVPFYNFLDQVRTRSKHSFEKSNTPLIDAMILFMQEFKVIDSAESVEKLIMRQRDHDLEQYGEAFTPDYIYDVIKTLKRFESMKRGVQQDAEEFLGFLLEELHVECAKIMQSSAPLNVPTSPTTAAGNSNDDSDWLEVGPKQKVTVSRSSGKAEIMTPIRKIFGGQTRSELRVGTKQQNPTEQDLRTLQLDIASDQVNNIFDAFQAYSRMETIEGFAAGKKTVKQNFIEKFPQVLIVHLKRFSYNEDSGLQKIKKKVGYPLELEIPKEVLSRQQLNLNGSDNLPRYRLIAVVYHHGKNALTGHYTVDVRRQEGQEWIQLDDTVIRRIRSQDVAEAGSEEDPKVRAALARAQKSGTPMSQNPYSGIDTNGEDDDDLESKEWQHVNASNANGSSKSPSSKTNGATTPKAGSAPKSKTEKSSIQDNKVAYLIFYEKI